MLRSTVIVFLSLMACGRSEIYPIANAPAEDHAMRATHVRCHALDCATWCAGEAPPGCPDPGCECPEPPSHCAPEDCECGLAAPNLLCDDGVTVAGPGCVPDGSTGTCMCAIIECPDDAPECGPGGCDCPDMPNVLCDDGVTIAGPGECVPGLDASTCVCEIIECPPAPCDATTCGPVEIACNALSVLTCQRDGAACQWSCEPL